MSVEDDLLRALDHYDELVRMVARGDITLETFLDRYGAFFVEYPLDGHEPTPPTHILRTYETRIDLHRQIFHRIITRLTTSEWAARYPAFIAPDQALEEIRELANRHLGLDL